MDNAAARLLPWDDSQDLPALVDEIVRRIVEVAAPDQVILFASGARGAIGPDSDLDFLVIKSDVPHRRRLAQEIYLRLLGIPVPVDVIVVTPEDVEYHRNRFGSIVGPALAEGREVYASPGA